MSRFQTLVLRFMLLALRTRFGQHGADGPDDEWIDPDMLIGDMDDALEEE